MAESIGRCVITSCKPGPEYRFPVGSGPGYSTRRKETRPTHRRDEFRPAIPQRVARQHCPSPLHRHHQIKTIAASNGIIYHRTVTSLLTVCLRPGDKPRIEACMILGVGRCEPLRSLQEPLVGCPTTRETTPVHTIRPVPSWSDSLRRSRRHPVLGRIHGSLADLSSFARSLSRKPRV